MCSEACAIGKPVHIFAPEGFLGDKHNRLVEDLVSQGYADFLGSKEARDLGSERPAKLDVAAEIASEIKTRILMDFEPESDSA